MLFTSGICAVITNDPGPSPFVPGIGKVFKPRQSAHPDIAAARTATIRASATIRLPLGPFTIRLREGASTRADPPPDQ